MCSTGLISYISMVVARMPVSLVAFLGCPLVSRLGMQSVGTPLGHFCLLGLPPCRSGSRYAFGSLFVGCFGVGAA